MQSSLSTRIAFLQWCFVSCVILIGSVHGSVLTHRPCQADTSLNHVCCTCEQRPIVIQCPSGCPVGYFLSQNGIPGCYFSPVSPEHHPTLSTASVLTASAGRSYSVQTAGLSTGTTKQPGHLNDADLNNITLNTATSLTTTTTTTGSATTTATIATTAGNSSSQTSNATLRFVAHIQVSYCLPCHTGCTHCTGRGPTDCTGCQDGYELWNNSESSTCVQAVAQDDRSSIWEAVCGGIVVVVTLIVVVTLAWRRLRKTASHLHVGRSEEGLLLTPEEAENVYSQTLDSEVDDEQPVFSPDWQFSQHISTTGGCVQGDQSDVILDIPQGALSQEQVVEIRGAVCTSLDEVHKQLSLPEDEYIVSPVVEYFAGPGFRSQKAMRVVMPHFLHPAFLGSSVKVYHFRRDRLGSVVCEPVLRVERDDLKYHSAAASSPVYVLAENRQIHVLTNHFSGYFCTDCGQEYPPPELLLEVHAKHANKTMTAVRLDVWDSRFNIRDFRENRTDKDSVNYSDMQLIDCKTLPALGTEHDLTTLSLGARLELMSEEDERVWMHCVRRNGEPLYPVFTTIQMKRLVPCTCRTRIPQRVDWQLTNQNEATPGEVFECLIDVGYVTSDLQRADDPERFMSDPRHVTIDVRVKKSSKSDANNKTTATATDYVGGLQGQKPRNNILQPNTVSPTTLKLFTPANNQSETVTPEVRGAEGGVQSLCTGSAGLGACAETSQPIIVQNAKHFSLMLGQSANSRPSGCPSLDFNSPFHSPAQVSQAREQFQRTVLWRHPDGTNTISADPASMMAGDPVLRNGTGGETGLHPRMFNERGSAEHAGHHDSLLSKGHVSVPIPVTEAENGLRPAQVCEDERESWGKLV